MTRKPYSPVELRIARRLRTALGIPSKAIACRSRARVGRWFVEQAPSIEWGEMESPVGRLFVALTRCGLCAIDFGRERGEFLTRLDPRARLVKNSPRVEQAITQLREYFAGTRLRFDLPIDFTRLTPFQRAVLETACHIAPGQVWTYGKLAEAMGRPRSSRPVGQALARNPVPIVIPCHRIVAGDGSLGGYSGGGGLEAKRRLLRLEGAL